MKNYLLAVLLTGGMISNGYAVIERQNINMIANITSPSDLIITPTAGTWPTSALEVGWNATSEVFINPSPIGFTVQSPADVTLSLSALPFLISGAASIPLNVAVRPVNQSLGNTINKLTLTANNIYEADDLSFGEETPGFPTVAYNLHITAEKLGMTGTDGSPASTPSSGNYTGIVSLVFESKF